MRLTVQAKIQVNTDTRMFPLIESVPGNVFVSEYSDRTRVAVDEVGYIFFGFETMTRST